MSTTLTNGLKLPDKGSVDWYADMQSNYTILDGAVGTVAEHSTQISGKAPLVHTHTKSDVTDLLNSNFIPSANNSYDLGSSSYQWNNLYAKKTNTDTVKAVTGSITIQSNGTDKNIGIYNGDSATDGGGFWAYGKDHSNGSLCRIQIYNTSKSRYERVDLANSQFFPVPSGEIDLGTSTNKWKSVYSDSYYYGTTAWGLDKANTWSNVNTFSNTLSITGNTLFAWDRPQVTIGTIPSSTVFYGTTRFRDSNNTSYAFERGAISTTWNYRQWFVHNFSNASINASFEIGIKHDGTEKYFLIDADKVIPNTTGVSDLGTSDKKWKTLNGINPGALSFPSGGTTENTDWYNVAGDILPTGGNATSFNRATANYFTPAKDGWLALAVKNCSELSVWCETLKYGISIVAPDASLNRQTVIPVVAGKSYQIFITGNSWTYARLIMPKGNV